VIRRQVVSGFGLDLTRLGCCTSLNVVEDRQARLDLAAELLTVQKLAFQRGKEALAQGVVEAIPDRFPRGTHAGFAASLAEGDRGDGTGLAWNRLFHIV